MKSNNRLTYFLPWVLAVLLVGCAAKSLQVEQVWARPGLAAGNSAVYFVIDNPLSEADTLLSAATDVAASSELHMSKMNNTTMMMEPQENVPVAARSKVEFKPGGLHLMLVKLNADLKIGDTFQLTLNFEKAGAIVLDVPVKEP